LIRVCLFPPLSSGLPNIELKSLSGDLVCEIKEVLRPAKQRLGLVFQSAIHKNYRHSRFSWIILPHQQVPAFHKEIAQIPDFFVFTDVYND
jgi:hypothetical protein